MLHRALAGSWFDRAGSTVELQNVDPDSAQEIYLAKNRNPRRLWKLAKSTLRVVLAVVGVRVTINLAVGVVSFAAFINDRAACYQAML